MDWELREAERETMAEGYIEGPNTDYELRSRVAAYVGEKMLQQSHAPMDIGEFEGEVESSDDQIDELTGTRKPSKDERSTHQRRPGKQPWKAPPWGRHEKREADNGQDSVKNQKKTKRDPPDRATQAGEGRHG